MKSRKSFLLRLDPALYTALERWAEQELRSVNGQIEFVLKQAVLTRDRKTLPPDENSETAARE
jgi:hypothetical protein